MLWVIPLIAMAVLLPVAAFRGARRLPPPRKRGSARGDVFWQIAQDFQLAGNDYVQVEKAVREGSAAPPRLQPAAHAMAKAWLHQGERFSKITRASKIWVALFGAFWLIGVVGALVRGRGFPVVVFLLWLPVWFVTRRKTSTQISNIRRAIEVNRPDGNIAA